MNSFDPQTLGLLLIFFVPGFISIKVYDLLVPSERRDFSKSLLEAVSFSCVNFALLYWAIVVIHSPSFQSAHPAWFYLASLVILFIAPVLWPVLYAKILHIPVFRSRVIHPVSKPWDYLFGQRKSYWVIVHLKGGRRIGGRFDTHSFASSYPAEEQIYLEEVWRLDCEGKFLKKVDRTKGIIISHEEWDAIEFFE